jgi:uncharacterized protein YwqG
LLFFYDALGQPWGIERQHAPGSRVVHLRCSREELLKVPVPVQSAGEMLGFPACSLLADEQCDLPDADDSLMEEMELVRTQQERIAYFQLQDEIAPRPYHHLGGQPRLVQDDMRSRCGALVGGANGREDGRRTSTGTWELLLQLDSDEVPGWEWGDDGSLYFWIDGKDLARERFDRTWTFLQCA